MKFQYIHVLLSNFFVTGCFDDVYQVIIAMSGKLCVGRLNMLGNMQYVKMCIYVVSLDIQYTLQNYDAREV